MALKFYFKPKSLCDLTLTRYLKAGILENRTLKRCKLALKEQVHEIK